MTEQELQALKDENARLRQQLELSRTAYDYLVRLAHRFSGEDVSFESSDQIGAFCQRISRSVELLVDEFKELLAGRKKVQRDWSLYSSAASEGTAMIRVGELHGDLGLALFDWRSTAMDENQSNDMRRAIDELKHHQLALMAGYERCVREGAISILRELDPDVLEGSAPSAEQSSPKSPTIRSLIRLLPWRSAQLLRRYRQRYGDLVGEDDRWFQSRFLPLFRQGYKEYMWKAKEQPKSQKPGGDSA